MDSMLCMMMCLVFVRHNLSTQSRLSIRLFVQTIALLCDKCAYAYLGVVATLNVGTSCSFLLPRPLLPLKRRLRRRAVVSAEGLSADSNCLLVADPKMQQQQQCPYTARCWCVSLLGRRSLNFYFALFGLILTGLSRAAFVFPFSFLTNRFV